MALFGLFGKKKKKFKMSKKQRALMAQQEQLATLANQKAMGMLESSDADRQRAETAAYESLKLRLEPDFRKRRSGLESQLWNQGIAPTNTAYKTAFDEFDKSENDAWMEAARQSVAAGQQSQNSTMGNVNSLFGIGAPQIDLPLSIYQMNQAGRGGMNPLAKGLFSLGNTALKGWASTGFKV